MKQRTSTSRNARVAVRLTREEQRQVDEASKTKGYASPSAFIRAAIRSKLDGRSEVIGTEGKLEQALIAFLTIFSASAGGNRRSLRWWTPSPKQSWPACRNHRPKRDNRQSPARKSVMTVSSRPLVRRCLAIRAQPCRIWLTIARTDDECEFRLRPPKPRVTRNEGAAWSNGRSAMAVAMVVLKRIRPGSS